MDLDFHGILKACKAASEAEARPRGAIISDAQLDKLILSVPELGAPEGSDLDFAGIRIKSSAFVPDHMIVWVDGNGQPIHVQDLRPEDQR